jgi:hypothetical protein
MNLTSITASNTFNHIQGKKDEGSTYQRTLKESFSLITKEDMIRENSNIQCSKIKVSKYIIKIYPRSSSLGYLKN